MPTVSTPKTGIDFLLYVNTGTEAAPTWTAVGGQRGASLSRSAETIDASYKGSGGWSTSIAGLREWSISTDAIYFPDDAALVALTTAFNNGDKIKVTIKDSANKGYEGEGYLTTFDLEFPQDDVMTVSIEIKGAGELKPVAA